MFATNIIETTQHINENINFVSTNALHCTFGRMNPPTAAHIDIVDRIIEVSGHHCLIVLSQTQNIKNPLTYERRRQLITSVSPYSALTSAVSLFDAMDLVDDYATVNGFDSIVWWCGTDRVKDVKRFWLYPHRWKTAIIAIEEIIRSSDDKRSGTAMRAAALNRDYETFERLAGTQPSDVPILYEELIELLNNGSVESTT